MKPILRVPFLLSVFTQLAVPASAFLPYSDLLVVSPVAARAGDALEVEVTGKNLEALTGLRFSHSGIVAEPAVLPPDDLHPAGRPVEGRFLVKVGSDVPPGVYEVRTRGYFGLSTARPFLVFPPGSEESREQGDHATPETALPLAPGAGVLGTLDGGRFDWYRFSAKKGERFLLEVIAERLDAKGDVLLAVFDATGRELESSRHHFGRDPFIDFTAPDDGDFLVSLTDSLYAGGREYFYHLRLGRGPHVDFVFPPAGEPGRARRFTFFGRNLPGGSSGENWTFRGKAIETLEVDVTVPAEVSVCRSFHPGIPREAMVPAFEYSLPGGDPVRIGFATAPVVEEAAVEASGRVAFPSEIAGRFDQAGDADSYRFSLKKGTRVWVEVYSHRLGVGSDPVVIIEKVARGTDGGETYSPVLEMDDQPSFYGPDSLDDLNADSLDPALSFTADADSDYRVTLLDQGGGGGVGHLYRLALREAQPGFQLLAGTELTKTINNDAFPAAPVVRRGGSMVYRIIALREDGFEGEITVTLQDPPPGLEVRPLVLSGKSSQGFLTVRAAPDAPEWQGPVTISGRARVGERDLVREALPASIVWGKRVFGNQAQVRSRLDLETVLSVVAAERGPTRMDPLEDKHWSVTLGQTLEIPVRIEDDGTRSGALAVNVHGFPGLLRNPPAFSIEEGASKGVLKFPMVPSGNFTLAPGRYQFVLQGVGNARYRLNPAAAEAAGREVERLKGLAPAMSSAVESAASSLAEIEKDLAAMKSREVAAADEVAKAAIQAEIKAAQARVDETKRVLAEAELRRTNLAKAEAEAVKAAATASEKAKEKSQPFSCYSLPVTVEVKAPAP